jgi:hypothetical protein
MPPAWGRPKSSVLPHRQSNVSIHAPAWGAAQFLMSYRTLDMMFQSTTRVGRDVERGRRYLLDRGFDPRPHGGDTVGTGISVEIIAVSIHAPAWGRRCRCHQY